MKKFIQLVVVIFAMLSSLYAELSKDDIKQIVEQYSEACINQSFVKWEKISVNGEHRQLGDFKRAIAWSSGVKNIRMKKVEGLNILIQYQSKSGYKTEGWIQLLSSGKIKYDPIVCPHPVIKAFNNFELARTYGDDSGKRIRELRKMAISDLLQSGIPTYNLRVDSPNSDQFKALDKIAEWLEENGDKWDSSEPQVFCPKEQFKDCLKKL